MRLHDPFQNSKLNVLTNYHGGGGGAPKPKPLNIPAPPPIVLPPLPKPAPPPPPPPTASKIELQEAADEQRRAAANRQGMSASLLAGETGGYGNAATGSTVLGAGNAQQADGSGVGLAQSLASPVSLAASTGMKMYEQQQQKKNSGRK